MRATQAPGSDPTPLPLQSRAAQAIRPHEMQAPGFAEQRHWLAQEAAAPTSAAVAMQWPTTPETPIPVMHAFIPSEGVRLAIGAERERRLGLSGSCCVGPIRSSEEAAQAHWLAREAATRASVIVIAPPDAGPESAMNSIPVKHTFVHFEAGGPSTPPQPAIRRGSSAPPVLLAAPFASKVLTAAELAHRDGVCQPCAYMHKKGDGCRRGAACSHCHLCGPGMAKTRKRHREKAMKTHSLRAEWFGKRGTH